MSGYFKLSPFMLDNRNLIDVVCLDVEVLSDPQTGDSISFHLLLLLSCPAQLLWLQSVGLSKQAYRLQLIGQILDLQINLLLA